MGWGGDGDLQSPIKWYNKKKEQETRKGGRKEQQI